MSNHADRLRRQAEARLSKTATDVGKMPKDSLQQLLYEFQVHQIELELQNQELKIAQQELQLSRDHYAHLYQSAPIGYLTLNDSGRILMANPAATRLLGADPAELIDKQLGHFIHAEDQDAYYFFLQDILHQHTERVATIRLKAPEARPAELNCRGFRECECTPDSCAFKEIFRYMEFRGALLGIENNQMLILLSFHDISGAKKNQEVIACLNAKLEQQVSEQNLALSETNRELRETIVQLKLAKRQLKEREAKLNAIFNATVEGIITMDMDTTIVSVNRTVETIFGYTESELINCGIDRLIMLKHREHHAGFRLFKFIGQIREVTGKHKDGSLIPLELSAAQFVLEETKYLAVIVRDISERKLQEQRDQLHLDELAHVTRLGLMGELASGIAHEVNQPLTAIVNYSNACLNLLRHPDYDKAQLQDILSKSSQQALKAGQIVHRMRDLTKAGEIQRAAIEINRLVGDALELCAWDIRQRSIKVHVQLAKHLPILCADSIQIEQVLLNLIKNGMDALRHVPISKPRKLSIQTHSTHNGAIEVRVKDNGPGIDETARDKILTPFYTTKSSGMGMGLSICRSIVEAHGGTLRFNGLPGKGATFYFTLPIGGQNDGNQSF
ncbi:PAS domain-containing sensor histidine kinase [Methylomonas sp. MgM2]